MCPFHSWRFDLGGHNTHITDSYTFNPEVLCNKTDMTSVRCETVAGLIFISMNDDVRPIEEHLGVVAEHLALYDIGR